MIINTCIERRITFINKVLKNRETDIVFCMLFLRNRKNSPPVLEIVLLLKTPSRNRKCWKILSSKRLFLEVVFSVLAKK